MTHLLTLAVIARANPCTRASGGRRHTDARRPVIHSRTNSERSVRRAWLGVENLREIRMPAPAAPNPFPGPRPRADFARSGRLVFASTRRACGNPTIPTGVTGRFRAARRESRQRSHAASGGRRRPIACAPSRCTPSLKPRKSDPSSRNGRRLAPPARFNSAAHR